MDAGVSIFSDIACELGEGPSFDTFSDAMFWFDITGRKLLEQDFKTGEMKVHELPMMASAIAAIDAETQLIATETGLFRRDRKSGALDCVMPLEADNAVTRSNDGRVHQSGALWIGTMGKNTERQAGSIYWYRSGELRLLYPDLTVPNSICFSPDGSIAYFTDTRQEILFRVECDPQTGLPTGDPKVFIDHRGRIGGLDGSVVDRNGNLWNARWDAGALDIYAADGNRLETIAIPALKTTCPAFAGRHADRLVVTSAYNGMSDAERAADPHAGKTFILERKVEGRPEPCVLP